MKTRSCQRDPDMLALQIFEVTINTLLNLSYWMKIEVDVVSCIPGNHSSSFSTQVFSIQMCSIRSYDLPSAAFFVPVIYV